MKTKILALLMVIAALISLTACSEKSNNNITDTVALMAVPAAGIQCVETRMRRRTSGLSQDELLTALCLTNRQFL